MNGLLPMKRQTDKRKGREGMREGRRERWREAEKEREVDCRG